MRTNKQDLFSIKRQEQDSSVKMDAVLFFFIDDFFESEEKEEFDTEISEDLLLFFLLSYALEEKMAIMCRKLTNS